MERYSKYEVLVGGMAWLAFGLIVVAIGRIITSAY